MFFLPLGAETLNSCACDCFVVPAAQSVHVAVFALGNLLSEAALLPAVLVAGGLERVLRAGDHCLGHPALQVSA